MKKTACLLIIAALAVMISCKDENRFVEPNFVLTKWAGCHPEPELPRLRLLRGVSEKRGDVPGDVQELLFRGHHDDGN